MDELEAAVARVIHGDAAAFRRIVELTSRPLIRLSARILGRLEPAEDVVQEAYIRAYRSLTSEGFTLRAGARTWLYRIVVNASIDARRGIARQHQAADVVAANAEPLHAESPSLAARLALYELSTWLETLPEEQRLAILLTAVEGLAAHEVAEILGCSEGAVEQRLLRARVTLRQKRDAP